MITLIKLIKSDQQLVKYDDIFNEEWTDDELLSHITEITIPSSVEFLQPTDIITESPPLSNCKKFICQHTKIKTIESLPKCEILICNDNQLELLPELFNCKYLNCDNNKLKLLPELPNCEYISCQYNQLTNIVNLNKCHNLKCNNNNLKRLR